MSQLPEGLALDLAGALSGHAQLVPHLFQGAGAAVLHTKAQAEHTSFPRRERGQHLLQILAGIYSDLLRVDIYSFHPLCTGKTRIVAANADRHVRKLETFDHAGDRLKVLISGCSQSPSVRSIIPTREDVVMRFASCCLDRAQPDFAIGEICIDSGHHRSSRHVVQRFSNKAYRLKYLKYPDDGACP